MNGDHIQPPTSSVVDRVLRSRGYRPQREREEMASGEADYQAFTLTPGHPSIAFTLAVYQRDHTGMEVKSHGIMYPDLKKPKWKQSAGSEYITFTHSGEAYTLRGHGLYEMYTAMLECRLHSAIVFEPSVFKPLPPGEPIIDRVAVTDVAEMVRRSREDAAGRDRPAH